MWLSFTFALAITTLASVSKGSDQVSNREHVRVFQLHGKTAFIPCLFKSPLKSASQIWSIGGNLYTLTNLPTEYHLDYPLGLTTTADTALNGTIFQCFSYTTNQDETGSLGLEGGLPTTLHVIPTGSLLSEEEFYFGHIALTRKIGNSVTIPCPFRYAQIWKVDGITYSLSGLPHPFRLHYVGLELPNVNNVYNQTEFRCYSPVPTADVDIVTAPLQSHIVASPSVLLHTFEGEVSVDADNPNLEINLDYAQMMFRSDEKYLFWTNISGGRTCFNPQYSIQSTTCDLADIKNRASTSDNSYRVPSNWFETEEHGVPTKSFLRVTADITCDANADIFIRPQQFFNIPINETSKTHVVQPEKEICISTDLEQESSLTAAWPQQSGSSEYCFCPLCSGFGCNFHDCDCLRNNRTNFSVELRNSSFSQFEVCWLNVTYDMNDTHLYIWQESRSCSPDKTPQDNLFYTTFREAVVVSVGGPPDTPVVEVNETSGKANVTVCFNSSSYYWLPIERYMLVVKDLTTDIYNEISIDDIGNNTYKCVDLMSLIQECAPYNFIVTAYNQLDVSNSTTVQWPNKNGTEPEDICLCFNKKLSLEITPMEVKKISATVEVKCSELIPNATRLQLQLLSNGQNVKNKTILCGSEDTVTFTNLHRSTHYLVEIQSISDLKNCSLNSAIFMTEDLSTTEVILLSVGILVAVVLVGIVGPGIIIIIKCKKRCKKWKLRSSNPTYGGINNDQKTDNK